jgi:hypothetical protein
MHRAESIDKTVNAQIKTLRITAQNITGHIALPADGLGDLVLGAAYLIGIALRGQMVAADLRKTGLQRLGGQHLDRRHGGVETRLSPSRKGGKSRRFSSHATISPWDSFSRTVLTPALARELRAAS